MSDIQQMTPEKLRLTIARARGGTFLKLADENGMPFCYPTYDGHYPNLEGYGHKMVTVEDPVPEQIIWPDPEYPMGFPNWVLDNNAAMELWAEMAPSHRMILHQVTEKKFHCYAEVKDGQARFPVERPHRGDIFADGETAAIAICRVWLAWKEAQA